MSNALKYIDESGALLTVSQRLDDGVRRGCEAVCRLITIGVSWGLPLCIIVTPGRVRLRGRAGAPGAGRLPRPGPNHARQLLAIRSMISTARHSTSRSSAASSANRASSQRSLALTSAST